MEGCYSELVEIDENISTAISVAHRKHAMQMFDFHQRQDDVDDKFEVRDGIIAGLRERIEFLPTGKDSSELEKKLAEQTHAVTVLAEQAVQMGERLQAAERNAEEEEEK